MTKLVATVLTLIVLSLPAGAQDKTSPGIEAVIGAQIDAFRAGDLGKAFSFASPAIQDLFQTPGNFGAMVREGYPSIWRPSGVRYYDQHAEDGKVIERMIFRDAAGADHWFAYEMIQVDGAWRINGVYPIKAPNVGV